MKLTLVSSNPQFLSHLQTQMNSIDIVTACEIVERVSSTSSIFYSPELSPSHLSPLLDVLSPLKPRLISSTRGEVDTVKIVIGGIDRLQSLLLKVRGSAQIVEQASDQLRSVQFNIGSADESEVLHNELIFGGASPELRQLIKWELAQIGIFHIIERQLYSSDDPRITLSLLDPAFSEATLMENAPLQLIGDDQETLDRALAYMKDAGYRNANTRLGEPEELSSFRVILGQLRRVDGGTPFQTDINQLLALLEVTDTTYAPSFIRGSLNEPPRLYLPTGALARGEVLPSDPELLAHWSFSLMTKDEANEEKLNSLRDQMLANGVSHCEVVFQTEIEEKDEITVGMRWIYSTIKPSDLLMEKAKEMLLRELTSGRMSHIKPTVTMIAERGYQDQCQVILGSAVLDPQEYEEKIKSMSSGYDFRIKTEHQRDYGGVLKHFIDYGFDSCEFTENSCSSPEIKFGGAPPLLIDHIASVIEDRTGHACKVNKSWSDSDNDIWVYLPAPTQHVVVEKGVSGPSIDTWFPPSEVKHVFVERAAGVVRIGDLLLPMREGERHELAPDQRAFDHYCIDQRTAEALYHVAESVLIGEPCLLEGETSVSKTSVIQYLAMLMNQPIVRLNLNGQTDTGELVGRYLPTSSITELPISARDLAAQSHLLSAQSLEILLNSEREERSLTALEVQCVIANERLPQRAWSWQNGAIVNAIQNGWWVILDELNLAEPQILERLNSLLELNPSLVLTERDNRIFGSEKHPIHPNFRIFGTMNPAEYSGRMTLSPAYRDRWTGYRFVERPHEEDYHSMLRYLIFGEQPEVTCFGRTYASPEVTTSPFAHLAKLPEIEGFLESLARFQSSLERAVDQGGAAQLGSRRREPYIFTRRGLIGAIRFIASDLHPERSTRGRSFDMRASLCRYYVNRVSTPEDRVILFNLLDAVGLGLKSWNHQL